MWNEVFTYLRLVQGERNQRVNEIERVRNFKNDVKSYVKNEAEKKKELRKEKKRKYKEKERG